MRRQDIQLRALARNGDIGARLEVGRRYLLGIEGFSQHSSTGIAYLTHPSVCDLPGARILIAECLPLDELLLLGQQESLRKAALSGSALAQLKFGTYLLTHTGRETEAAAYYAHAAAGEACAARALAICESVSDSERLPKILRLLTDDKKENGCAIAEFAEEHCEPTAKQERWGTGFRNRREVIRKCLPALGLSSDWLYHGIEREVFVVPLARNAREFLRGQHTRLICYRLSEAEIFGYFRDRWMLPRVSWDERFKSWSKDQWAIWLGKENGRG